MTDGSLIGVLLLGGLVGIRHALDADHIAAVASLATRAASLGDKVKVAAAWSGGHAATLLLLGSLLIGLGASLPEPVARGFELAAGATLIVLGLDVLGRLRARRVHFHVHQHDDGARHLHVHAHAPGAAHTPEAHDHEHIRGLMPRALVVGGVHGLAGSGALVLLSMQLFGSGAAALLYVLCFGVGSIVGMVAFSLVLSLPFSLSLRGLEQFAGRLEAGMGVLTICIGAWMAAQTAGF